MKFTIQIRSSYFILLLFFISVRNLYGEIPKNCIKWLEETGLDPKGESCLEKCQTSGVEMGTYDCPKNCKEFCKIGKNKDEVSCEEITHPSLWTKFWKYPKWPPSVNTARKLGYRAQEKMRKLYPGTKKNNKHCNSWTGGKGDAFRHCYWSCLMANELGEKTARDYGDVQEFRYPNRCEEAKMDYDNNRVGLDVAKSKKDCEDVCVNNTDLTILEEEDVCK